MTKAPLLDERILFKGHPAIIGSVTRLLISIFTLGIGAIWFWVRAINTHYLITSQRIVIEKGLFSKNIETLRICPHLPFDIIELLLNPLLPVYSTVSLP